jgi:hypothetical protein
MDVYTTLRKTNTCTFCGTTSYMLWYDGYEVAYITRRRNNKDTAACGMYDRLYKQTVFTIL